MNCVAMKYTLVVFIAEPSSANGSIFLKILTDLSSENVKKDKNILQHLG